MSRQVATEAQIEEIREALLDWYDIQVVDEPLDRILATLGFVRPGPAPEADQPAGPSRLRAHRNQAP